MSAPTSNQKIHLSVSNLNYAFGSVSLLDSVKLSFSNEISALVGPNGSGKTTLAKLLLGELSMQSGILNRYGSVGYLPQDFKLAKNTTIADFLDISKIIEAIKQIEQGCLSPVLFDCIGNHWDIEQQAQNKLQNLGFQNTSLMQYFDTLSGGEQTLLRIAKLLDEEYDFIILDEPTNHLDFQHKQAFLELIQNISTGVLIITHDRFILDKVDRIIAIENRKIQEYGGNYEFYLEQKSIQQQAIQQQILSRQAQLHDAKKQLQVNKKHYHQRVRMGKNRKKAEIKARGQATKASYNYFQNRSEKGLKRLNQQAMQKQKQLEDKINELSQKEIEVSHLDLKVSPIKLPKNKNILSMENVDFSYSDKDIFFNFNLSITGPARVRITGRNGSGKSTLLELMTAKLKPNQGHIQLYSDYRYLTQKLDILEPDETVMENFERINPNLSKQCVYNQLSVFLFKKMFNIPCKMLSGGEKMRLALACILLSRKPPSVIILDEPTNHMDLESIQCIEKALNEYTGALIIVTHDDTFSCNVSLNLTIKI